MYRGQPWIVPSKPPATLLILLYYDTSYEINTNNHIYDSLHLPLKGGIHEVSRTRADEHVDSGFGTTKS